MADMVSVIHEIHADLDTPLSPEQIGRVTREAFDTLYADKGWVIVDPTTGQPVKDPAEMTKAELVAHAEQAGVSVDPSAPKADIYDALTGEGTVL